MAAIFDFGLNGQREDVLVYYTNSNNILGLVFNGGSYSFIASSFNPTLSQWYHYGLTSQGTTMTYFVNGLVFATEGSKLRLNAVTRTMNYIGKRIRSGKSPIEYIYNG